LRYQTDSVEESVHFCQDYVGLDRLTRLDPAGAAFQYRYRLISLGPVEVGEITYVNDVRVDFVETAPKYRISLPLNGAIDYRHRNVEDTADSVRASIFGPGDPISVKRWPSGTRVLVTKLDHAVVEAALAGMIGASDGRPIAFEPCLPTDVEPAASWMSMAANIEHATALLQNPLMAPPFADSLARGLLLAGRHRFSRHLERAAAQPRSAVVRAAVDYIEQNADQPLTVSDIAMRCHIGARALQIAFKRHLEMSPMAYLRQVRLRRIHADLQTSDPGSVTVSSVAHQWGFTHLGRLAADYRAAYGRFPAETLRQSR
jgi:AraC-like DNA-binding protein